MRKKNDNIAIIGLGALGTLFGARLTPLANVTLVGRWPEQTIALEENGLHLTELDGSTTTHRLAVTNNPETVSPADFVLVMVKSHQTQRAAQLAAQLLKPDGIAVTLQNGLGNLETLTAVLGPDRVLLGTTTQGAVVTAPGHTRHAGNGPIHLATSPSLAHPAAELAALCRAAGFETHIGGDLLSLLWGKLAINAGINPLTALLNVPNGFLVENSWWRSLMINATREVADVAQALGITLPYTNPEAEVLAVATATADNISSMLQDVRRGAPTEINAICGQVVQAGVRHFVPTPTNRYFLEMIHLLETGQDLALWQERIKVTFSRELPPDYRPATGA